MTTLITRLYAEEKAADGVASRLRWEGLPGYAIQVITGTDKARLADRMTRAKVHESAIEAYTAKVAEGAYSTVTEILNSDGWSLGCHNATNARQVNPCLAHFAENCGDDPSTSTVSQPRSSSA